MYRKKVSRKSYGKKFRKGKKINKKNFAVRPDRGGIRL